MQAALGAKAFWVLGVKGQLKPVKHKIDGGRDTQDPASKESPAQRLPEDKGGGVPSTTACCAPAVGLEHRWTALSS